MAQKILIDAAHSEETRVVVAEGNQTLDFDFENTDKQQITGNVYLAKVTRVEPSLQAAFLDYGGNRHGFLAFSEIHPDYYQIPKADKEALLEEQAAAEAKLHEEDIQLVPLDSAQKNQSEDNSLEGTINPKEAQNQDQKSTSDLEVSTENQNETLFEEDLAPRKRLFQRKYKIQEVIKVRQILLIQITKEERGNKGAALTTYISIAGRYCVLMPNTSRGGGISKKITNVKDRQKLKSIIDSLNVSKGSGLIVRTAGGKRTKTEIKRDYEFLLKTWESVRVQTMESIAPDIIHEEGNLIKRAIRDLYNRDVTEIIVEGEKSYKEAKNYLKLLMPSHAKFVKKHEGKLPIFSHFGVENYLQEMFNPIVQLKSGGYIVIGITEALVAIDVNSGRATKERTIEETALKTNLEASTEIARQLKLRDLAGLIVIDFIDMEERKNNSSVERKLKDCISLDRARIQLGRISSFGLLEMSRQRLRPGMIESTTTPCLFCHGTGTTRSDESLALQIIRSLEKEGALVKDKEKIIVTAPIGTTNFLMNFKRDHIKDIESRFQVTINIEANSELISPNYKIMSSEYQKNELKQSDIQNGKSKKKHKKQRRETQESSIEAKESFSAPQDSNLENETTEEQKRRKKRRRKKLPRDKHQPVVKPDDKEAPSDTFNGAESKQFSPNEASLKPNNEEKTQEHTINKNRSNSGVKKIEHKEVEKNNSLPKKARTKASVKKTLESLNNDANKTSKQKTDKEQKMGKKGWWDREQL